VSHETDSHKRWLADTIAGVSVALIAVPQAMAYAELAGMPPHTGLYAAALPSLFAAFFASSPYLQTGPVALTSLLALGVLEPLAPTGSAEYVGLAALLALLVGAVRVAVGLFEAGPISYLMSRPMLRGFTTGAAVLILASQLPKCFGVDAASDTVLGRAAESLGGAWNPEAIGLSLASVVVVLGSRKIHRLFPGVLVAVVGGTLYSSFVGYDGAVVGNVPAEWLPKPSLDMPWSRLPELLLPGATIALVGFAEAASISRALAERGRTRWNPNREFIGQGVANLTAALVGAFPVGGSLSRSAVNKEAGARSRVAGGITGLAVLAFVPFASVLAPLPAAVLGGIVVASVVKLLDPRPLVVFLRQSRLQGLVAWATFALTLLLAPRVDQAVLAGIALAMGVHVWREQSFEVCTETVGDVLRIRPSGVLWYGSVPRFRQALGEALAECPELQEVEVDLGGVGRIDLTGALALRESMAGVRAAGVSLRFAAVPTHALRILASVFPEVPAGDDGNPTSQE